MLLAPRTYTNEADICSAVKWKATAHNTDTVHTEKGTTAIILTSLCVCLYVLCCTYDA